MSQNVEDLYPLSPLQQGMLFHDLRQQNAGLYFNQLTCELRGALDVPAFIRAWEAVLRLHPILRSALVWEEVEEPLQVVLREVELPFRVEDWTHVHGAALEERWATLLEEDRRRGFDVSQAPLLRLALLRTGEDVHRFVFSHHHVLLDGWSLPILIRQVFVAYAAALRGGTPPLERTRPYRDYIEWIRSRPEGEAERHFRSLLQGFRAPLHIGALGAGRAGSSGRGEHRTTLPAETTSALERWARRSGLTLSTVVQGAWALLLSHVSGTEDVVFGVTVSGRPPQLAGIESMVGLFINSLPVRARLSRQSTVREWLAGLQEQLVELRQHEHTPLLQVQRWSEVPAGAPLFESLVVFENYPVDAAVHSLLPGLELADVRSFEASHLPVSLVAVPGRELALRLCFDRARLGSSEVEELARLLCATLTDIGEAPERRLAELPLLGTAVRHRVASVPDPAAPASSAPAQEERAWTSTEEQLAALWREVLRTRPTRRGDGFFELGGHSLMAMQLAVRIRAAFGVDFAIQAVFDAPTLGEMAGHIERLRGTAPGRALAPLARAPREGDVPLSFAQRRLWFLEQLQPGSTAYLMPGWFRLRGRLDADALERSLLEVVRRHEVLRARFVEVEGRPIQRFGEARFRLERVDLGALEPTAQEAEVARLAEEETRTPMSLAHGPLLRGVLIRLGAEDHVLLATMHHIVSDGWSLGVLAREVAALYPAFVQGLPSPLPELALQYADYAHWQQTHLAGEWVEEELAYWRRELEGAPARLALPTDHPRPAVQRVRAAFETVRIPARLTGALRALGRSEDSTLFMVLLSAFQGLLARHSGQEDLVVGTPTAGRTRRELEPLIGFFLNMLALRARIAPGTSFRALLRQTRERSLGAFAHQEVPFERVVEALQPVRDLSTTPLFQVLFVLTNTPDAPLELPGLTLTSVSRPSETAKFDLTLTLEEQGDELVGAMLYNRELFEPATIHQLVSHLMRLLERVVEAPDQPVLSVPLLSAEERARLLGEWAGSAGEAEEGTLPERWEAQVARTPGAVALRWGSEALTFAELDLRARQVAQRLRRLGVGPDVPVGVFLERSPELVVAILGVLRAGGAYVPLDPSYPRERLESMLADSGARALLYVGETGGRMLGGGRIPTVSLGAGEALWREPAGPLEAGVGPDHLAYVIFTSGSTGRPKPVGVRQGAVVNLVSALRRAIGFERPLRFTLNGSVSFDTSVKQLFQLLDGHAVDVTPKEVRYDGEAFLRYVVEQEVDVVDCTPSQLRLLLEAGLLERLHRPLRVLLGGEAIDPGLWSQLSRSRWVRFFNVYGPTEATVDATACAILPGTEPSLGRPIPGARLYVLAPDGQPSPLGVAGELFIGGAGVARGYLGRPDATAERFAPDPFAGRPGARMYRTGDLVRWRADGALEFLGRADDQVKLRGHRIELGEIDAVLGALPGVRASATVLREDGGIQRLVSYVVMRSGHAMDPGLLRAELKARLPEPMVPAAFVHLEALPLTPSAKVDRARLPPLPVEPVEEAPGPAVGREEEALARIWREVLGVREVGSRAHFFELGGHSLLATQVISRIRRELGVELPVRALFESPVLGELAARLRATGPRGTSAPLRPRPREGGLPVSLAQQRLWLLAQLEPDSPAYNVPYALRLKGRLDVAALEAGFRALVERHEVLRTTFGAVDGAPLQRIHRVPRARLIAQVDLEHLAPEPREAELVRRAEAEAAAPFDLEWGPLFRATLLRMGPEDHVLVLVLHHIVTDGWSLGVLVRDLAALYGAALGGGPTSLPPLPLQYADFALWQREVMEGGGLRSQLDYWKRTLAGSAPVLALPTDRPRAPLQTSRGGRRPVVLPRALVERLEALGRSEGCTLFMVLLAGFKVLLARASGQRDILVGTPTAGRTREELEALIGFFVGTLVLRTEVEPGLSFRELLARVRETALGAYAHQDVPFDLLVDELKPARSLSHTPLFQVMFALQNQPRSEVGLEGVTLTPVDLGFEAAKFDLTLALEEGPEGLRGTLGYNADLFEPETIDRMVGQLRTLLEAAAEDPDGAVSRLRLLPEEQREQVVREFNRTAVDFPPVSSLVQLLEEQAARTPERLAVTFEGQSLTFRELHRRANLLARELHRLGVRPDGCVGICMERSLELVVGLLGILKAGAAYVPLEPSYPPERLAYMLGDSQVSILLTQPHLQPLLPEQSGRVVSLAPGWGADRPEWVDPPVVALSPDHLAYVLYTSGSTGRPKGVMVPHRGICNRLLWMQQDVGLSHQDRVLQKTPFSFDVSVWEFFAPLITGARLVVASPGAHQDVNALVAVIEAEQVTVVHFVPPMLRSFLEASGLEGCASLRRVICSGEALSFEVQQRFFERLGAELQNLYGPTEASVDVTAWRCERSGERKVVPIGRPIANTQLYVLDARLQPLPVGVPGELYIAGVGLARGYWRRPDLTAERFLPNPFSTRGERMYRTGDLARWLPDGSLEFLGRLDHQVKVRGVRVELGEVEAALAQHPGVRACVVVAREDRPGDTQLVAYVVPTTETPGVAELKAHLSRQLPEAMVPAAFVSLEALPLSPNGKVDRRSLPAPRRERTVERSRVAPRDVLETQLVQLWEELLEVSPIGVTDDFFELGGHSLLGVRLLARMEKLLGRQLPLVTLFRRPTIAGLAEELRGPARLAEPACCVPLSPPGPGTPLFLVHPVGGNVLCYRALAQRLGADRPVLGIQAVGVEGTEAPLTDVPEMALRYLAELRRVQPRGPYLLGGWSFGGLVAFQMAQELRRQGEEVALLALIDSFVPSGADVEPGEAEQLARFAEDLARAAGARLRQGAGPMPRDLPADAQLRWVWEEARKAGALPEDVPLERVRALFQVARGNQRAARAFRPSPYAGTAALLRAERGTGRSREDRTHGWAPWVQQLEVIDIPGDHYSALHSPEVDRLAAELRRLLERSEHAAGAGSGAALPRTGTE